MAAERIPTLTSGQWLARVGLVLALGTSEVVLAAVCGIGGASLVVLALASLVFVVAYLVTPSPGKPEYEPAAFRPIYAMAAASIVAIAATGALVPIAAVPLAIAWTMRRPQLRDAVFGGFVLAVFAGSLAAGELAVWSTVVATCAIGRRVVQLLEAQRSQSKCLGRIREGALVDAESRRRGMELMTTKLAHELKNPLAAIKSLVQVEAKGAVGDKSQRRLAVALAEIDRMSELIRDYLNVARPIVETSIAVVQLDELMTDVSTLLAGRAEAAGVTLVFAGDGGRLHADAQLLKEALVNIVSNAIEATQPGGEVTVHYHLGSAGASIVIRDTGRGMTKEAAARVGTPFFTTRENGTGLGVVIAKTAIAQHGGTLEYKSTPGIGTIATIVLPVEPSERYLE